MSRIITSIDLGCFHFKGVIAEQQKNGNVSIIHVFKQQSSGFRKGVLVDYEDAYGALERVFSDLKNISKKTLQNVFINLQSEHIRSRFSRGAIAISNSKEEIKEEDIERVGQLSMAFVKSSPGSYIIDNIVKEYIVDDVGDIFDPLGMRGNRLEVENLIIEGVLSQINPITKLIESLGGNIAGMAFNPIAAADAVLTKKQKNLGTLLIDFGFETTNIAVFEEGKLIYAKTIPAGGHYITKDIALGLKVSMETAEELKLKHGEYLENLSKSGKKISNIKLSEIDENLEGEVSLKFLREIVEIRVREILDVLDNEIKSIGKRVQFPAGIIITGGSSKLYKISDIVKDELKAYVNIGYPILDEIEVLVPAHRETIENPEFSVAVGMLVKALSLEKSENNRKGSFKDFLRNFLPQ